MQKLKIVENIGRKDSEERVAIIKMNVINKYTDSCFKGGSRKIRTKMTKVAKKNKK